VPSGSLEASIERSRRPSPASTEELSLIEATSTTLSSREATWERKKAQELVQAAEDRLAEDREDLAAATFCRAFDVLDRPELESGDVDELRLIIVRQLAGMAGQPGVIPSLVVRGGKCMKMLRRDNPALAVRILEWSLDSDAAPAVYETLVDALVSRLPMSRESAARAHRVLAKGLEVRLGNLPTEGLDIRRLLLRLHVGRPELPYPRLYLARLYSMEERYEDAAEILNGLRGDLAFRTRVLNLRGRCAELLGRCEQAEAYFAESLKRRPDQADVHFRVGRLMFLRVLDETGQANAEEETQRSRSLPGAKSRALSEDSDLHLESEP
jgi:tetratricopeptide (TPR) repeat protein